MPYSHVITYELYLRVTKVWIEETKRATLDDFCCAEKALKILEDYGDARNIRIFELSFRQCGDPSATDAQIHRNDP
jgi:hypothetical protein